MAEQGMDAASIAAAAKLEPADVEATLRPVLPPEMHRALSALDDRLVEALARGDLLGPFTMGVQQPAGFVMPRSELEQIELRGAAMLPLLTPKEAVYLIRSGRRPVGLMSRPWLSSQHPDPKGWQLQLFCGALKDRQILKVSSSTLHRVSKSQEQRRGGHLSPSTVGDRRLFASAIGTTVPEMKEIPPRPAEFDLLYDDRPYDERGW